LPSGGQRLSHVIRSPPTQRRRRKEKEKTKTKIEKGKKRGGGKEKKVRAVVPPRRNRVCCVRPTTTKKTTRGMWDPRRQLPTRHVRSKKKRGKRRIMSPHDTADYPSRPSAKKEKGKKKNLLEGKKGKGDGKNRQLVCPTPHS